MKKMKLPAETIAIIDVAVDKAVKATVKAKDEQKCTGEVNYYKQVERLLYAYPDFVRLVESEDETVKCLELEGVAEKSKSIVAAPVQSSSAEKLTKDEILEERLLNYKNSLKRTKLDLKRLQIALDSIKNDDGFAMIEMIYFRRPGLTINQVADQLYVNERTVFRWKSKLINKLGTYIFGSVVVNNI